MQPYWSALRPHVAPRGVLVFALKDGTLYKTLVGKDRPCRVESGLSLASCSTGPTGRGRGRTEGLWTASSLPVAHTAAYEGGEDAEGKHVQHVGQQHLPLVVQAVLALLVTDGTQHRNWAQKAGFRRAGHHTAGGAGVEGQGVVLAQAELEVYQHWVVRTSWSPPVMERRDCHP